MILRKPFKGAHEWSEPYEEKWSLRAVRTSGMKNSTGTEVRMRVFVSSSAMLSATREGVDERGGVVDMLVVDSVWTRLKFLSSGKLGMN